MDLFVGAVPEAPFESGTQLFRNPSTFWAKTGSWLG